MVTLVTSDQIIDLALASGLSAAGVVQAQKLTLSLDVLKKRKKGGLAGEMQFTYRNPARSSDPYAVLPSAKSLIAGAYSYGDPSKAAYEDLQDKAGYGVVARYARENSYDGLRKSLKSVADFLKSQGYKAVVVADSNALVDREVAWIAGLGWYGKNSNMLLPDVGSWFVLGSIVTNAELENSGEIKPDGCGSCNKCIDDCPTQAIVGPGIVDATRCISWLVQSPEPIPLEFRELVGTRIYGCDDCQEVCPPNHLEIKRSKNSSKSSEGALVDMFWLLSAEDNEILDRFTLWYIPKRNPDFVRRTALVVLGNSAVEENTNVPPLLKKYLEHKNPLLRAHAVWAAKRLGLSSLLELVDGETNDMVRSEICAEVRPRLSNK